MSAEQLKAYNTASWWDIGVLSMSSYMVWVVLYYLKVCYYTHIVSSPATAYMVMQLNMLKLVLTQAPNSHDA